MGVKPNEKGEAARLYSGAVRAHAPLLFPYALAALAVSAPSAAQELPDAWLGPDKPAHALGAAWTAGAALAAALAKEAYDRWTQGERFSFKDLAAGAAGLLAFVALSAAADH